METSRRSLSVFLFFAMVMVSLRGQEENNNPTVSVKQHPLSGELEKQRNKTYNVEVSNRNGNNGGEGGGGGGGGWGPGNGGGGGGWGGGGGGWWGWGCRRSQKNHTGRGRGMNRHHGNKRRSSGNEEYRIGEFAECMGRGRCQGMRLDCPLHCGGPCFYDCKNMCKAHCRF